MLCRCCYAAADAVQEVTATTVAEKDLLSSVFLDPCCLHSVSMWPDAGSSHESFLLKHKGSVDPQSAHLFSVHLHSVGAFQVGLMQFYSLLFLGLHWVQLFYVSSTLSSYHMGPYTISVLRNTDRLCISNVCVDNNILNSD